MQRDGKGRFTKATTGESFEGFGVWDDFKGYPCIWLDGRSVKIHVLVWERTHGPKPPGTEIHHRDLDKGNYALENLELLTKSDHQRIHAGWVRQNDYWVAKPCSRCNKILALDQFYPRKGHTPTALCKPCTNAVTAARNKAVPEKRRIYNQRWYAKQKAARTNA